MRFLIGIFLIFFSITANAEQWEEVNSPSFSTPKNLYTYRLEVPGGWIVHISKFISDTGRIIFIEDKQHEWKIK